MAVPIQSQINNPISGVFGIGQMQIFSSSGTWTVPPGVAKVRVRMWGAGANYCNQSSYYGAGGGGGFALKAIYDLTGVTSVAVTVGAGNGLVTTASASGSQAGTSSFGAYCSATGGICGVTSNANNGGAGVGGDINNTGGAGGFGGGTTSGGGGGSASLIGNGGRGSDSQIVFASSGGAGGGTGSTSSSSYPGGNGFMTTGGVTSNSTSWFSNMPTASIQPFSIDFIGTGGGGGFFQSGVNGGGGAFYGAGGFPGGGCGYQGASGTNGLVIVEW